MSLINVHETNDLSDDGASHFGQMEVQTDDRSDAAMEGTLEESSTEERMNNVTGTTDFVNAVDQEPDVVTRIDDRSIPPTDQTSTTSSPPSPDTTTPAALSSTHCQETTTMTSKSFTPFVGAVQGPVVNVYSPFIEDQREVTPGPNVFEKNIRNAIELREHEDTTGANDQQNDKRMTDGSVEESTPSSGDVLETPSNREYETSTGPIGKTELTDPSVKEHDDPDLPEVLPEEDINTEESETLVKAHGNGKQAEISVEEAPCDEEKTKDIVLEPCNKKHPDTPVEANSNTEAADTPVEAESVDQGETNVPNEIFPCVEHPKEVETQTDSSALQTQPADAHTIAQAKEWHDSIVGRLARLRGLSCWLGERNKRMDGMVEILVRSLEHMGVGAVTDHIGNLIPLQNFRLNSAIKLSTADNTWTTCDDEIMSNDINAWLPGSLPDDHNLPLTNEQMSKYESQVEVLRAENEALQRSLQTALDNQGSLGVQINQWQACIDSAGQQLCQVTQEVHDSKSRERHLRHLLGEERRIKDSLVQQNSVTKAEQDHTTENVNCWPPNINEGISGPSQSATSATVENSATFLQGVAADTHYMVGGVAYSNYAGTPSAQTTFKGSPVTETPWQQKRGLSSRPRDTHSSRLNSSAPPFISAYSSPHRQDYHSNWHAGSDWHPRSGSGRTFGSGTGRGRHGSGRGYYRKEHSTNVGFNRLLDGFFDNLNRIENALRQQGINVPGPTSDAAQVVQQQQQQQVVCSNVNVQYPTVNDLQPQQQQATAAPNQPIYYSPPIQPVVYSEPVNVVAQPVQSIPSMQQVPQSPVVQAIPQPHVQFAQVEGQAY